jgi:uncharacterized membrane protein (DUF485 family)
VEDDIVQRVKADPNYQKLVKTRSSYGWLLTWAVMIVYYGFTLLNSFDKPNSWRRRSAPASCPGACRSACS